MHNSFISAGSADSRLGFALKPCFAVPRTGSSSVTSASSFQRPWFLAYIGREPPSYYQPHQPRQQQQQSFGNSATQLGCSIFAVLAVIRFLLALPTCAHSISTHVAQHLSLSNITAQDVSTAGGYTTIAWSVTISNSSSTRHVVTVNCDFENAAGLVLASDKVTQVEVQPGAKLNFKDNHAVTDRIARQISKIDVQVY
jgi:hypothetical protein